MERGFPMLGKEFLFPIVGKIEKGIKKQ